MYKKIFNSSTENLNKNRIFYKNFLIQTYAFITLVRPHTSAPLQAQARVILNTWSSFSLSRYLELRHRVTGVTAHRSRARVSRARDA